MDANTAADTRAKTLIYLVENKLMDWLSATHLPNRSIVREISNLKLMEVDVLEKIAEQLYRLQQKQAEESRRTCELLNKLFSDQQEKESEPVEERRIGFQKS